MRTVLIRQSDTTSRLRCIIPMASPVRHRERAGKFQLPAVQTMGSLQDAEGLCAKPEETRVSGHNVGVKIKQQLLLI